MDTITYTDLRSNLAKTMDKVVEDHSYVVVTRSRAKPVVIMSLEDFASYEETAYLSRSPVNAKRLADSIEQIKNGHVITMDLNQWREKYKNGNK